MTLHIQILCQFWWPISDIDFISITPNLIMASWRHRNVRVYRLFSISTLNAILIPLFMTQLAPTFNWYKQVKTAVNCYPFGQMPFFASGLCLISPYCLYFANRRIFWYFFARLGTGKVVHLIMFTQCSIVNPHSPKAMYVRMLGRELKE